MIRAKAVIVLFCGLVLAACDEDDPGQREGAAGDPVKAIKTYVVSQPSGNAIRQYSGSLVASHTSALSFPVAGTVKTVTVAEGDSVTSGQVLTTLDPAPFELDRDAAQAEVNSARATLNEKQTELERQRTLFQKGWVARAALEQAISAAEGAEASLNLARSRLGTAERDLQNAALRAPFDGLIASRDVEPFQEVSAGQALFQINSDGALEVLISISDSVVSRVALGSNVQIDVPTVTACGCTGRVVELGTASGTANAVTAKAALINAPAGLLPGMSAEVSIPLEGGEHDGGFLVPLTAIVPGDEASKGYVFIFDPDERVVRKVPVRGGDGAIDNLVNVVEGVSAGDIVASAGVSFLRDGQAVKLLGE